MADTTLKYVVDTFDKDNMVLMVTFPDDGTVANIGIKTVPTTQAELDAIVKPYGTHAEVVANIQAVAKVDTSFLTGAVGKTYTTTRFSAQDAADEAAKLLDSAGQTQAAAAVASNEVVFGAGTAKDVQKAQAENQLADLAYIKQLIQEALAAQTKAS